MPETTTTTESDPELLDLLRDAGRRWGPLGVALAAASLTDREALIRKLTGVTAAEETTMTESAPAAPDHDAEVDRELTDRFGYALIERFGYGPQREVLVTATPDPAIAARNAHRRCHHCGSETPDDIGTLLAELRRLRHQYGKVAGELADATMTMWHLEPGDRSDMPLAERITTLVAELTRQRAPHHPETGLEAT